MNESKNRKGLSRFVPVVTAVLLAASLGTAAAQPAQEPAQGRSFTVAPEETGFYVWPQSVVAGSSSSQVPQDIRIMQRIVRTALDEVEGPEVPEVLRSDDAAVGISSGRGLYTALESGSGVVWVAPERGRPFRIGSRDINGFYMQGYGYLFTIRWRVASADGTFGMQFASERLVELAELSSRARRARENQNETEARAAGEAEEALQAERDRLEERRQAWETWSAEYRDALAAGLREVVAQYGSTLRRAAPEESITFIADFGGGEQQTVTVSARRGDLTGASRDQNLGAVRMSTGDTGVSDDFRTELKIMAEIIDTSLQTPSSGDTWTYAVDEVRYFGGDSSFQYVPGYGVLFRKAARLNLASNIVARINPSRRGSEVTVETLREQMEQSSGEQRETYAAHLADLKEQTATIMATYGPTLTGMGDDEWFGVYYNVGSAAGLLEGGITNYLVQARMSDVRQAANQSDGAAWLLERLVTNEKQD